MSTCIEPQSILLNHTLTAQHKLGSIVEQDAVILQVETPDIFHKSTSEIIISEVIKFQKYVRILHQSIAGCVV